MHSHENILIHLHDNYSLPITNGKTKFSSREALSGTSGQIDYMHLKVN